MKFSSSILLLSPAILSLYRPTQTIVNVHSPRALPSLVVIGADGVFSIGANAATSPRHLPLHHVVWAQVGAVLVERRGWLTDG
jgi:hypothetical protein